MALELDFNCGRSGRFQKHGRIHVPGSIQKASSHPYSQSRARRRVMRKWSWTCPNFNPAAILSHIPSESLQFPQFNLLRFVSVILQINVRTRPTTHRFCGYRAEVRFLRMTIANSPRTITPIPTDGTTASLFHNAIPAPSSELSYKERRRGSSMGWDVWSVDEESDVN